MLDPNLMDQQWPNFFGVVEDRQDPLKLGRVRVRVHGLHDKNKTEIRTEDLPWAHVAYPVTAGPNSGVGAGCSFLTEGTQVCGFIIDNHDEQEFVVTGVIPGIPLKSADPAVGFNDPRTTTASAPKVVSSVTASQTGGDPSILNADSGRFPRALDEPDTNRLARAEGTILQNQLKQSSRKTGVSKAGGGTWDEPASPYAAQYPYNHSHVSESGHAVELDDTPNAERINIQHRVGSFVEFHPSGDVVQKALKSLYEVAHTSGFRYVGGDEFHTVGKAFKMKVNTLGGGAYVLEVGAGGDLTIDVLGGNLTQTIVGNADTTATAVNITATTAVTITAPAIVAVGPIAAQGGIVVSTEAGGSGDVDVAGGYKVDGLQVVSNQQGMINDLVVTGSGTDPTARATINLVLAALRAHGLIAP